MKTKRSHQPVRFGLRDQVIREVVDVFKKHPEVESAILYGSRAMGNFRPGSDIDLTLVGKALTYQIVARIENEIDDLLLPYLFDISILSHIDNPNVIDHINRVGVAFYPQEITSVQQPS